MSNQLKFIYSESCRRKLSIGICMGPIGEGFFQFFGTPPSSIFLGHFHGISNISLDSSALSNDTFLSKLG